MDTLIRMLEVAGPIGLDDSEARLLARLEREAFERDLSYLTVLALHLSNSDFSA